MIKYALRCAEGHEFDSWFASSADYDRVAVAGHLTCAVCGDPRVEKSLMAPRVASPDAPATLRTPSHPAEAKLRAFRAHVESRFENVGRNFAAEARRIAEGEAPERGIRGQARAEEARALWEDGIRVLPLPWPAEPDKNN